MVQKDINAKQKPVSYQELCNELKQSLKSVEGINRVIEKIGQSMENIDESIDDIKRLNIGYNLRANLLEKKSDQKEIVNDLLTELHDQKNLYIKAQSAVKLENKESPDKKYEKLQELNTHYNSLMNWLVKDEDTIYLKAVLESLIKVLDEQE
ncbi:MAG: hypothetical protein M1168_01720 [Candidatus Marsarchaeota archaeon]|nr:hypothetical protein [Candidatus Marsarchaeota archaeon]MCL5094680.1 hypothetical protein [Candidatus Marsarchaeota archaeon]